VRWHLAVGNPDSPAKWIELARRLKIEVPSELLGAGMEAKSSALSRCVRPSARAPKSEVESWFKQRMEAGESKTEASDWEEAQKYFGSMVTRQQVRAARQMLPPEAPDQSFSAETPCDGLRKYATQWAPRR
jgi:hypothetical protein